MSQVITAMYNTADEAMQVQTRLVSLGIVKDDEAAPYSSRVHDRNSHSYREGHYSTHDDHGLWATIKHAFEGALPDDDRHDYEEGVHRGHALLTVTVDDEMASRARTIIDESHPVDLDEKRGEWERSGWTRPAASAAAAGGSARYANYDRESSSARSRTYRSGNGDGPGAASYGAAGVVNNAIGNIKQAAADVTGSRSLHNEGVRQERKGEGEIDRAGTKLNDGNEL